MDEFGHNAAVSAPERLSIQDRDPYMNVIDTSSLSSAIRFSIGRFAHPNCAVIDLKAASPLLKSIRS